MLESQQSGEDAKLTTGQEWLVDASGCAPERLKDAAALAALFEELVVLLELKVMGQPQWHVFPEVKTRKKEQWMKMGTSSLLLSQPTTLRKLQQLQRS